ncbi:hypothetical protein [Methylobacterium sp. A54F]
MARRYKSPVHELNCQIAGLPAAARRELVAEALITFGAPVALAMARRFGISLDDCRAEVQRLAPSHPEAIR